ncbi:MAG: TauD/TfdA family dioxygenase [Novosphingobium sp.]|nr:TauD/TfdA family dioxygenase [Novosphingobium sp.]MCP5404321.1 TauD/TfdA family dioxygenase [Novosphingobium sp.]
MNVTIEPIKEHIGAIVHVDKEHLCDDDVVQAIRDALEDRGVLVFPKINLTDEEQLAFTDKFGERVKFTGTVPGGEGGGDELYKITLDKKINKEPDYVLGTYFWHMDGVTIDQPLPKATMLSARALSPTGGQTEFASTFAAYENLPEDQKKAIEDLKVIHRMEASMRPLYVDMPEERLERYRSMATWMVHPLVWSQKGGRKSLVLGTHADEVIGMPVPEGRALLAKLTEWAAQPDFSYSHDWQEGDFVVWNNCGLMHRVVPYEADCGRMMHRTTIMGTERLGRPLKELEAA